MRVGGGEAGGKSMAGNGGGSPWRGVAAEAA